jgi:hypothetical protein
MVSESITIKKFIEESEKISFDQGIFEKYSGLLELISQGVLELDKLPIPMETEPFFTRPPLSKKPKEQ